MEEIETWKSVAGFEGEYEVSDLGRVRSLTRYQSQLGRGGTRFTRVFRGKVLSQCKTPKGRPYVDLRGVKSSGRRFIHVLVLETFVGPCPEGMEGCHGDGDPANSRLDNLRWGTPSENWDDRRRHGRTNSVKGERHPHHKLTEDDVKRIRRLYERGARQTKLAGEYGVHQVTVSEIVTRKIWAHV